MNYQHRDEKKNGRNGDVALPENVYNVMDGLYVKRKGAWTS